MKVLRDQVGPQARGVDFCLTLTQRRRLVWQETSALREDATRYGLRHAASTRAAMSFNKSRQCHAAPYIPTALTPPLDPIITSPHDSRAPHIIGVGALVGDTTTAIITSGQRSAKQNKPDASVIASGF